MKFSIGMTLRTSALALAALGAFGCEQAKRSSHMYFFPEQTKVPSVMEAQAAAGARGDATLYPMHFDGAALNSLGIEKVTRIAPAKAGTNVVIYLDIPNDASTVARKQAVTTCMADSGVDSAHLKLEMGANPGTQTMTAPSLARLSKTETSSEDSASGSASMAPSAAPAAK